MHVCQSKCTMRVGNVRLVWQIRRLAESICNPIESICNPSAFSLTNSATRYLGVMLSPFFGRTKRTPSFLSAIRVWNYFLSNRLNSKKAFWSGINESLSLFKTSFPCSISEVVVWLIYRGSTHCQAILFPRFPTNWHRIRVVARCPSSATLKSGHWCLSLNVQNVSE